MIERKKQWRKREGRRKKGWIETEGRETEQEKSEGKEVRDRKR
jgi:hypothetical protein